MANLKHIKHMQVFSSAYTHMVVVQSGGIVSPKSSFIMLMGLHFGSVETLEIVHHAAEATGSQYTIKTSFIQYGSGC
jgi:hypothetical protein